MKKVPSLLAWSVLSLCIALTGISPAASAPDIPSAPADDAKLPGTGPFNSRPPYQAEHIAAYAKRSQADQGAVVFLGDSITEFWGALGGSFRPLRVANRGIASDTTRGMLCRLKETVLDASPRAVVLLGGINDLRNTNNPPGTRETIAGNIRAILTALKEHDPKMPVLVCEILPSGIGTPDLIKSVNDAVDKVVADFPNAIRVKTNALFLNPDGTQNKALFTDGVHLKPEGYAIWRQALAAEFAKLDLK